MQALQVHIFTVYQKHSQDNGHYSGSNWILLIMQAPFTFTSLDDTKYQMEHKITKQWNMAYLNNHGSLIHSISRYHLNVNESCIRKFRRLWEFFYLLNFVVPNFRLVQTSVPSRLFHWLQNDTTESSTMWQFGRAPLSNSINSCIGNCHY